MKDEKRMRDSKGETDRLVRYLVRLEEDVRNVERVSSLVPPVDVFTFRGRRNIIAEKPAAIRMLPEFREAEDVSEHYMGGNPFDIAVSAVTARKPTVRIKVKTRKPINARNGKIVAPIPLEELRILYDPNPTGKWMAYFLARVARKKGTKRILLAPVSVAPGWKDWEKWRKENLTEIQREFARRLVDVYFARILGQTAKIAARENPEFARLTDIERTGLTRGLGRTTFSALRTAERIARKHVTVKINGMRSVFLAMGDADEESIAVRVDGKPLVDMSEGESGEKGSGKGKRVEAPNMMDVLDMCMARGIPRADAEIALESLMQKGYISYARNKGHGVPKYYQDRLKEWGFVPANTEIADVEGPEGEGIYPLKPVGPPGGLERRVFEVVKELLAVRMVPWHVKITVRDAEGTVDEEELEVHLPEGVRIQHDYFIEDGRPASRSEILAMMTVGTASTQSQILDSLVKNGYLTESMQLTAKGWLLMRLMGNVMGRNMDLRLEGRTASELAAEARNWVVERLCGKKGVSPEVAVRILRTRIEREMREIESMMNAMKVREEELGEKAERWLIREIRKKGYVTVREFRIRWNLDKGIKKRPGIAGLVRRGAVEEAVRVMCPSLKLSFVKEGRERRIYVEGLKKAGGRKGHGEGIDTPEGILGTRKADKRRDSDKGSAGSSTGDRDDGGGASSGSA